MLFSSNRFGLRKFRQKKPTVFCLPGFHADPMGRLTQVESIETMISLVRQYLLACRADSHYGVYLSEIDYLKPFLDLYPEERSWIIRLVQQQRCATGGSYNQSNETSISGEALLRNLLLGSQYHKTLTGYDSPVYMAWDGYGHIPQLPQILNNCGMKAVVFTRTNYRNPSIPIPGVPNLFQWYAPNGTFVYARRIDYAIAGSNSLMDIARQKLEALQKEFPNLNADLLIDAADIQPPRTELIGHCQELAENDPSLVVTGAAAAKYFSHVHLQAQSKKCKLEPSTRDISQYNEGGELSRIDLKLANRLLENRLFEAEIWGSIAAVHGIPYPSSALDFAWRQLLFCQHHNGITGCGTDIVFVDLMDIYREALEIVTREMRNSLESLAVRINIPPDAGEYPILLFNALPWLREGLVQSWIQVEGEIESYGLVNPEGEAIPYEIDRVDLNPDGTPARALAIWPESNLLATGYIRRAFKKRDHYQTPFLKETQRQPWIENEFLRVEVDPARGGGIVSIFDKETGKEFINQKHTLPANNLFLLNEGVGDDPAWRLLTTGDPLSSSDYTADVKSLGGPITHRLVIKAQGPGSCNRIQEIRLYKGLPFIDCRTILENYRGHESKVSSTNPGAPRDFFALSFPLDLPGSIPILEDRFYAKAYRRSHNNLKFLSSFNQWDSEHAMNSCYRWVDVSWSLLFRFMNGKEEVASIAIGPAEIVTARDRHRELRQRVLLYLSRHGITCTPRYDTDDPGSDFLFRTCSFSIGTIEENAYTSRLLKQNPKAMEYYERNMNEFGSVFLVVGEIQNDRERPVFIFAGKTDSQSTQIMEEMFQSTIAHRWESSFQSYFLSKNTIVEDYGFALLNLGTSLCSQEQDGTLVMALMHTTPYPSPQTPWPFDFAEQKNHVFQYRLIPHRGDWRHAEIPRRAMEYNHEPYVQPVTSHEGTLPSQNSFFSIEPNNILLSCIKPEGFPEAAYSSSRKSKSSFIIRLYESHGEESNIWLESNRPVKSVKAVGSNEQPLEKKREVFREEQFIRMVAHANEILTLKMELPAEREISSGVKSNQDIALVGVPARYWQHNAGSAPAGFLPLTLSLRGTMTARYPQEKTTIHPMELVLVNNSPSESYNGKVEVQTPSYWRSLPAQIAYRLEPGSYQIIPLQILQEGNQRNGYVKALTVQGLQRIEDLIPIGAFPEFDIAMTLRRDSFQIKLTNENPYLLSGSIRLITPIEAWPDSLVGEYSFTSFTPRKQDFTIEPGKNTILVFSLHETLNRYGTPPDHHWMVVKLETHNCLRYYHVRMDGRSSEGLGRVMYSPYEPLDVEPE